MDEIILGFENSKIKMLIHDNLWCEMYLVKNKEVIALGGERLKKIISGLSNVLNPKIDRKYFDYQNMKLFTIFNLMGPHAVITGRKCNDSKIELIFLDVNGGVMPMVHLSLEDITEWVNKLEKYNNL